MVLCICPYQKDCDEERAGHSYGVPVLLKFTHEITHDSRKWRKYGIFEMF